MTQKHLLGKTALITGASRGIGRAVALRLASFGADIMVNYVRNEEAAQKTVEELKALGVRAACKQANVGDLKDAEALVDSTLSELGGIDILVHSAALGAFKPVHQLRPNQWDLSMDVNTKAFLNLTKKVIPGMEKKSSGCIIALSSLGSRQYIPNYGAIGISKSALESLVRYLAVELAPKGIRVNCVSGGLVDTDAIRFFPDYQKMVDEVVKHTPMGRIAQPDDIAKVVAFLASPESGWIVGQTLIADGGMSLI